MFNLVSFLKEIIKFGDNKDYIDFKSSYFSSFTVGLGILSFLGSAAWLFKDIFILKCEPDYIGWVAFFRLYSGIFLPFYFITNNKNKRLNWVLTLAIMWAGIIGTLVIDITTPNANGYTGDGWITYYFFFFVLSIVANRQGFIYASYGLFSILVLLSSKEYGGPVSYTIPIIRPISTGMILSFGLMAVSLIIRYIFTKLYTNETLLKEVSKQDILSGAWNRKKLEDVTDENYFLHRESTIFMIDIDHFKSINDTYGHTVGDDAIKLTTSILQSVIRQDDLVIRYGGDEFIILFDGIIDEDVVFNRIQAKLKSLKTKYSLSFSIGTFKCDKNNLDLYASIKKADTALYISKENGKNKMTKYEDMLI